MANDFLSQLLKGNQSNPIANSLTPEEKERLGLYLGEPQGMAASLPVRSGDVGMPQLPVEEPLDLPPPMGMAESLMQRSGDDLPKPTTAPTTLPGASSLLRKENVVDENSQVRNAMPEVEDTGDTDLEKAIANRDRLLGLMMIGKGAERVGTAISGTESDKAYLEGLKPIAESKVSDVLTKRRAASDKVDLETKKFNYAFAKDKDDPSSPSSKFYRETLKELARGANIGLKIPDNLSAAEMEKVYPNIINIVNAKEARAARMQQAELAAQEKRSKAGEKTEDEKKKFTRDLRKELTSGQYGKLYGNVNNSQKAAGAINEFMKNPTGYSDYATLMSGLKSLQGDESVVREAEIRLGMDAGSFKEKVTNQIDRLRSGKSLQPKQRQAILDSVKVLHDVTLSQYNDAIKPVLDQATDEGIDVSRLIPGNIQKDHKMKDGGSGEVERQTKDGKIAIFDAKTKKFLRYKE